MMASQTDPYPRTLPTFNDMGWASAPVRCVQSPNFDDRPDGIAITLLVVHAISLPPNQFGGRDVEALFTNRLDPHAHPFYRGIEHLRVSAHFYIPRGGSLIQFVSTEKRAWHAGVSQWQGRERCNDFSIGVELEGCDTQGFTRSQYYTLVALTKSLQSRYPITDIVGHADIAPGRKTDPGVFFDWMRYRRTLKKALVLNKKTRV